MAANGEHITCLTAGQEDRGLPVRSPGHGLTSSLPTEAAFSILLQLRDSPKRELFIAGRYSELENLAQSLLKANPDSGVVWKLLGLSLHVQGKDALFALRKAAGLLPNDAEAHANLAAVLRASGQLDAAVASFKLS